jgi:hypothetical protein
MPKSENIRIIHGAADKFVREGCCNNHVDVYKPVIESGYYYDVNSLYPFAMKKVMPTGVPTYVLKPLTFYGFCRATVFVPVGTDVPFLLHKTPERR